MVSKRLPIGIVNTFIILVFLGLLSRLFYLQVITQSELGEISSQNSVRRIPLDPARGIMIDRNGKHVVDNQPLYSIQLIPAEFDKSSLPLLAKLLKMPEQELKEKIRDGRLYNKFSPVKLSRDVSFEVLAGIEENSWRLPGVSYAVESKRKYLENVHGSHIFGYTKIISKRLLEELPNDVYERDDIIGYSGLEKTYERVLRGQKGEKFVLVNSLGKVTGKYEDGEKDKPALKGNDLYLTLDANLQALAEKLLDATGKSGAAVAIDPNNGEVLALCSSPSYDLDVMSGYTKADAWQEISRSPKRPLFNRATQTRYPPGSTYKLILSIAALEEKLATENTKFTCTGHFYYGNKDFLCHGGHGHGSLNMTEAIQHSCNSYFYNLMFKVGLELWAHYGDMFGFGKKTSIDLPDEQSAPLPTKTYFNSRYGERGWTQGYLVSLAIGQGEMGASPLQMAAYTAAIANKGTYHRPHLVKGYAEATTGQYVPLSYESRKLPVSEKTFDIVRNGMRLVVESGTARTAQIPGVVVAGKTGTAQNPHGEDHAWFICFAPYDNPQIALAVLVENAGYGGTVSAPIAREMIDYYLNKREPSHFNPETATAERIAQLQN
ncbi:penicillin-binding protein 2 [Chloroherpeton thalassium ATCC 35110]|uniref:Penicillin-binding protein 2 n=1 Tax=Chloroherpeton thalassium (strain ATCC 35110 / GB-78) TaxID=517418 RepID=B3QX63_CHLT3|nr:penicillin-binding protein 2 [Chloroherpeton thalassium]ACF14873.1 penicillin-binding protein 2 [Chloroherpeton thalassium ATCC 35110]